MAALPARAFNPGLKAGALARISVAALAVWLFVFRPALTLTGTDLVVRNPWGTRRVPLAGITGTGGAYTGLRIERRSGTPVTAWAVQKSKRRQVVRHEHEGRPGHRDHGGRTPGLIPDGLLRCPRGHRARAGAGWVAGRRYRDPGS